MYTSSENANFDDTFDPSILKLFIGSLGDGCHQHTNLWAPDLHGGWSPSASAFGILGYSATLFVSDHLTIFRRIGPLKIQMV